MVDEITVEALFASMKEKGAVHLIDVREKDEHDICHIKEAELVPLDTLKEWLKKQDKTASYVMQCRSGMRSYKATEMMQKAGFNFVKNLKGGILEWIKKIDPSLKSY